MKIYKHKEIEDKWRKKWNESNVYKTTEDSDKEKFYILDMFPYPSGEGLHVGHPKGYIATDIISRYKKMQNFNVLHPMGWDAFGLPAEQYALKNKVHPRIGTDKNIATFKKQLEKISLNYDWEREISTTDPEFYKWTQWTFIQMYKKGLIFQSNEPINWCPSCKTGLANEDLENGCCERCDTPIEKKKIPQWVIKITDYADRMLADIDKLDWQESIKESQRNWIGRSEGANIEFRIKNEELKENVLILHGWESSSKTDFIPWLKDSLEKDGHRVFAFDAPNTDTPDFDEWYNFIEEKIAKNNLQDFSVVGHSMGGLLAMKLAEKYKIKNLVLVAPVGFEKPDSLYFEQFKEKLTKEELIIFKNYQDRNLDIEMVKQNVTYMNCIFGEKDGWITDEIREYYIENFGDIANIQILKEYGHMSEDENVKEVPEILSLLQKKVVEQEENVILMHGKDTNPQEKWYLWLAEEMNKKGILFVAPVLKNAENPYMDEWLAQLDELKPNKNTVLIGHSRGGVAILRWLEKQPKDFKVKKVILVAANYAKIDDKHTKENTHGFYTEDGYDFEKIKQHCDDFVVLHSHDDDWVPFEHGEKNAKGLDAKFLKFDNKGHFGSKLIKQELPEVIVEILDFSHSLSLSSVGGKSDNGKSIKVFTTRPDTLYGATYMVLAPEHGLLEQLEIVNRSEVAEYQKQTQAKTEIERTAEGKEKTGVRLEGVMAVNPVNGEEIPIFIADYVLADYGTGAIMAVPAHDERDFEFAQKYDVDMQEVVEPLFIDKTKSSAPKKDLEFIERDTITAIVKHWEEDKYLTLKWKKVAWITFITGGIEEGQTAQEAARTEILEETGYKNLKLIKNLGKSHSKFFHNPKNVNRFAHFESFYFELESDEQNVVSDEEKVKHDIVWMTAKEVESAIVAGGQRFMWDKINNDKVFTGTGIMVNSGEFDGMDSEDAKEAITQKAGGEMTTSYKLRDWVFSRQRYWGEPIPLIHCEKCGVVTVPEDELPLILPEVESYEPTGTGESPLAAIDDWVNTECPECSGPAKRETNTMPQWAGSSWYYLRYIDPKNDSALIDKDKEKYWSPVDFYVGGAEHATRHLIYARFWHKFLYDIGVVSYDEPFSKLQTVGLIMAEDGRKMSKRWGNVINPDDIIDRFGSDTFRVYEMFMGPFDASVAWSTDGLVGPRKFLERIWKIYHSEWTEAETSKKLKGTLNKTIKKVGEDIEDMKYNTAISAMMMLSNEIETEKSISSEDFGKFLKVLSPFAPHLTQELWSEMGNNTFLIEESWPEYDEKYLVDDEIELVVQVNGKVRDKISVATGITEEEATEKALASENVQKHIDGKEVRKVIFVQGKLISIVV
ncbi:MAG: alpha/beta fold hydrolase [Candidatus Moraniibacteriota bacterium]|jgi:leucyl-tRNA synthetase/predicted alpha/beta hydrolase family esterase